MLYYLCSSTMTVCSSVSVLPLFVFCLALPRSGFFGGLPVLELRAASAACRLQHHDPNLNFLLQPRVFFTANRACSLQISQGFTEFTTRHFLTLIKVNARI
jgi:hypothetical protein